MKRIYTEIRIHHQTAEEKKRFERQLDNKIKAAGFGSRAEYFKVMTLNSNIGVAANAREDVKMKEDVKMLMNQLYTAYYSDGRIAHEKPLDWIYQNQGNARVEIRPTIWLWKVPEVELYLVDYVGQCAGFTLQTFGSLKAAEEFKAKIGQMEESEFKNWLLNRQQ